MLLPLVASGIRDFAPSSQVALPFLGNPPSIAKRSIFNVFQMERLVLSLKVVLNTAQNDFVHKLLAFQEVCLANGANLAVETMSVMTPIKLSILTRNAINGFQAVLPLGKDALAHF